MAYFSQDMKKQLSPLINKLCKEYGVKASISVRHHMNLTVTIRSGDIDFIGNHTDATRGTWRDNGSERTTYMQVNQYYINDSFTGIAAEFLTKLTAVMNKLNHDNSDIMIDYFDVGYYTTLNIGEWDKPYILNEMAMA